MTFASSEGHHPTGRNLTLLQRYALIAGILLLVSVVAGAFGEYYIPSTLVVSGDAAATAKNIVASNSLFRVGFAAYLIEAMCDISLSLILYALLKTVGQDLALLATFFRLIGTGLYAVAEFFYYAALLVLGGSDYLKTFSPGQLDTLALLFLNLYRTGGGIFLVFSGVGSILLGYLIYKSGYIPKLLGALLALGGGGFATSNFILVLAPQYLSFLFLLPTIIASLPLTIWFLTKGIRLPISQQK